MNRVSAERIHLRADFCQLLAERDAEIERLRKTNTRLNRRCQQYEAALAEKVNQSEGSLGRRLANLAYEVEQAQVERAEAVIEAAMRWAGNAELMYRELAAYDKERDNG
jgi:hypothetical protein